jgi:hypothetical protein
MLGSVTSTTQTHTTPQVLPALASAAAIATQFVTTLCLCFAILFSRINHCKWVCRANGIISRKELSCSLALI